MSNDKKKSPKDLLDRESDLDDAELFRRFIEQDTFSGAIQKLRGEEQDTAAGSKTAGPIGHKSVEESPQSVDLHGLNLAEAKNEVELAVAAALARSGGKTPVKMRIITGKGRHSQARSGVLVREIYDYFVARWRGRIIDIDASPADAVIGGLPIRGHFDATLK